MVLKAGMCMKMLMKWLVSQMEYGRIKISEKNDRKWVEKIPLWGQNEISS